MIPWLLKKKYSLGKILRGLCLSQIDSQYQVLTILIENITLQEMKSNI